MIAVTLVGYRDGLTMVQIGQFMLGLTQNVSLLALLIVGYVWIRRVPQMTPVLRDASVSPHCSAGGSPPCSPTQSRLAIGSGWADRCMRRGSG